MPSEKIDFVLASASPRRNDLLKKAGYNFIIIPADINEADYNNPCPIEHAKQLALIKAEHIAKQYPDKLVLGADTIAELDGEIIGKPDDADDALRITKLLFSKPHKVITGIAIIRQTDNLVINQADTTTIYPKKLTEQDIQKHIDSNTWKGKAGAYAIQETGDRFVEKIEGSLTNVMGLPMELLQKLLKELL